MKTDKQSQIELNKMKQTLADEMAEDLFKIVKEEVEKLKVMKEGLILAIFGN